jgi:hypothetical protein
MGAAAGADTDRLVVLFLNILFLYSAGDSAKKDDSFAFTNNRLHPAAF